jgi:hypothetical protein
MLATAGRSDDTRGRKPPGRKRPMERIDRRRLLGGVLNGEVVERVVEAGGRRPCAQEGDAMKTLLVWRHLEPSSLLSFRVSRQRTLPRSIRDAGCLRGHPTKPIALVRCSMGDGSRRPAARGGGSILRATKSATAMVWRTNMGRMRNGDQERYSGESHRTTLRETRRANTAPNTPLNSTKS